MSLASPEEPLPSPVPFSISSAYLPPEEYWLEELVRGTKWHTRRKIIRLRPAEPYTEHFTAALDKEGAKWYFAGEGGRRRYEYEVNLHHILTSTDVCSFEAYLERALQAATSKTAVVLPYKHYAEPFTRKLDRERIPWRLHVEGELSALKALDLKREFPVYLSLVEPSFMVRSTLSALLEKGIFPSLNGRVVQIIPSVQTPLLTDVLAKRNIPYYVAHPRSAQNSRKEYQVDLTRMVLE